MNATGWSVGHDVGARERERVLREWSPSYVTDVRVLMPPTWNRPYPTPYTLVFTSEDLNAETTRRFYRATATEEFPNPRLFTPFSVTLSSLYHPLFFKNVAAGSLESIARSALPARATVAPVTTVSSWLQTVLFLAGVTLSAAIVQNRFSRGTIESKLSRLWQAGAIARRCGLDGLCRMNLEAMVESLARSSSDREVLYALKEQYREALANLVEGTPAEHRRMTCLAPDHPLHRRFGFVADLAARLGENLRAAIAYGSATTGASFADYDLVLVVRDAASALSQLAGTAPMHDGREINLSVHSDREFEIYQRASGDNLFDYGVCLHGEVDVPYKPREDLLHRNLSFAYVRMRQIMGMAAFARRASLIEPGDDKANLYGYFVKIPMNVFKGTHGVDGNKLSKEAVADFMSRRFGYDAAELTALCARGDAGAALATAVWCTEATVRDLNETFHIFNVTSKSAVHGALSEREMG